MTGTATVPAPVDPDAGGYRHEALFYDGPDALIEPVARFAADGVAEREPVLVALRTAGCDAVRRRLGRKAAAVEFVDMEALRRNPARIIPAWQDFLDRHPTALRLRGVGEPVTSGLDPARLVECQRHEQLLNLAFRGRPFWLRCPYDTSALAPEILAEARRSHPLITDGRGVEASADFRAPGGAGAGPPLPPPPTTAAVLDFGPDDLAAVRGIVEACGAQAGLDAGHRGDLVLAANEIATNSIRHGGGAGTLRLWNDGRDVYCQLEDAGHIDDPLVGRVRPGQEGASGRGLWIANQVCDLVQIRLRPGGLAVRLRMAMRPAA